MAKSSWIQFESEVLTFFLFLPEWMLRTANGHSTKFRKALVQVSAPFSLCWPNILFSNSTAVYARPIRRSRERKWNTHVVVIKGCPSNISVKRCLHGGTFLNNNLDFDRGIEHFCTTQYCTKSSFLFSALDDFPQLLTRIDWWSSPLISFNALYASCAGGKL